MVFGIVLIFLMIFIQAYWSMFPCSDKSVLSPLEFSYKVDTAVKSVFATTVFIIIYFLTIKIDAFKKVQNFILFTVLLYLFFYVNKSIFIERIASWSTYSTSEINYYTFHCSYLQIFIFGALFMIIFIFYKKYKI